MYFNIGKFQAKILTELSLHFLEILQHQEQLLGALIAELRMDFLRFQRRQLTRILLKIQYAIKLLQNNLIWVYIKEITR